jgi:hypothetical protein
LWALLAFFVGQGTDFIDQKRFQKWFAATEVNHNIRSSIDELQNRVHSINISHFRKIFFSSNTPMAGYPRTDSGHLVSR